MLRPWGLLVHAEEVSLNSEIMLICSNNDSLCMNSYLSLVTNLALLASLDYHGYNGTIIIVNLVLGETVKRVT